MNNTERKKGNTIKLRRLIAAAVMVATATIGLFMMSVPAMSRQHYTEAKNSLLEAIERYIADSGNEESAIALSEKEYEFELLSLGILTVESINMRLPVIEGVRYETLNIAPGWVPETAEIGKNGNAVIAGHRNYTFGEMFNRLGELTIGDIIGFQSLDGRFIEFEIFEKGIIDPTDQIAFIQPWDDTIITLFTCTPINVSSHRLILRAMKIV